jgi:sensor histidine kinase YesM
MPSWLGYLPLIPGIALVVRRFPLASGRWPVTIPVHMAAAVFLTMLHMAVASFFADYVFFREMPISYGDNLVRLLSMYGVIGVAFYWAFVGAMVAYDSTVRYQEQERTAAQLAIRASRLEAGLVRANLEALRMQLNPHFLFNALNGVSVLALKGDRHEVVRTLARLSELLRLALENDRQQVSLAEELHFLDTYLEIEEMRFKDRLTVSRQVPPEVLSAEVPSLLLQPLVENAVRHGIARRPGPGRIEVGARREADRLILTVRDTGPGFSGGPQHGTGSGVGLANTRARLEQLYGTDFQLDTTNAPEGGGVVRVTLPYRPTDQPAPALARHA